MDQTSLRRHNQPTLKSNSSAIYGQSRKDSLKLRSSPSQPSTGIWEKIPKENLIAVVTYLICGSLCLWQVGLTVNRYFSQMTVSDVKPEAIETFKRPIIVICPPKMNFDYITKETNKLCQQDPECQQLKTVQSYPLKKLNMSADTIWSKYRMFLDIRKTPACDMAMNITDCHLHDPKYNTAAIPDMNFQMNTLRGQCIVTYDIQEYYFDVKSSGRIYFIGIKNPAKAQSKFQYVLVFRDTGPKFMPHDFTNNKYIPEHYSKLLSYILSITEFRRLNQQHMPCFDEYFAYQQYSNCIEKELEETLPCQLPFFNSSKRQCETLSEIVKAHALANDIYEDHTKCSQLRKCKEVLYSVITEKEDFYPMADHQITYTSNLKTVVTEKYAFGVFEILSEMSGNLGFFLDLSFIAILQVAANISTIVCKMKGSKKINPNKNNVTLSEKTSQSKRMNRSISKTTVIWAISLSISTCICTWQVCICILRYYDNVIITGVTVERADSISYPMIYLGPFESVGRDAMEKLVKDACKQSGGKNCNDVKTDNLLQRYNLTMKGLLETVNNAVFKVQSEPLPCTHAIDVNSCETKIVLGTIFSTNVIYTPMGLAVKGIGLDERFHYHARKTAIWKVHVSEGHNPSAACVPASMIFHDRFAKLNRHDYYKLEREFTICQYAGVMVNVDLVSTKRIKRVEPCYSEEFVVEDYNNCLYSRLENFLPCRPAFYNYSSKLAECLTIKEYFDAQWTEMKWASNQGVRSCQRKRKCEETVFTMTTNSVETLQGNVTFTINILHDVIETISERVAYPLSSMSADISNIIGFFIGISLLGLVQSGISLFDRFLK